MGFRLSTSWRFLPPSSVNADLRARNLRALDSVRTVDAAELTMRAHLALQSERQRNRGQAHRASPSLCS